MEQIHGWYSSDPAVFAIFLVIVFFIHFLPSIIAFSREHPNRLAILLLNILLGWTLVGWVILLIWATKYDKT